MNTFNSHIKHIIEAKKDDRLAIFVGSGVSLTSNTENFSFPSWGDLISELKQNLNLDDESDYLKIAQLYFLEFGEPTYYKSIQRYFPKGAKPSLAHELIFKLNPQCIITTNWDSLLEDSMVDQGKLYSKICSDKDLVKAKNQKKLIKMHGDFNNHNIVFKEDDYLSYSHNFPLIENYIKSILSTHTVLFLGYSYSDINLKHIMKWIQNNSAYCPPMYLVNFTSNQAQELYLSSHGIKVITLPKGEEIQKTPELDKKHRLESFLEDLEEERVDEIVAQSDQDVANYVYDKLKHFSELNIVDLKQLRAALTNCGFEYPNDGRPFLNLYDTKGVLTNDYNETIRVIYQKFKQLLIKIEDSTKNSKELVLKVNLIKRQLAKANIEGIIVTKVDSGSFKYHINDQLQSFEKIAIQHKQYLNFSNKIITAEISDELTSRVNEVFKLYLLNNYREAFLKNLELVSHCYREKNYTRLLISLFNSNLLLWKSKFASKYYDNKDKFHSYKNFNLQEKFFQLPVRVQEKYQSLYDFLSLKSLYEVAYSSNDNLCKVKNQVTSIENGGFTFSHDRDKPIAEHIGLLMYVIQNKIMMLEPAFTSSLQNYFNISIDRQSFNKSIILNVYEIYTAIKYFDNKDLYEILNRKFGDKKVRLELSESSLSQQWLIDEVLVNIMDNYFNSSSIFDRPENELINSITVLAFLKLEKDDTKKILMQFNRLVASTKNSINTYQAINRFLGEQHNLYKNKIDSNILIELVESIINKIVYKQINGWDRHVIQNNSIGNFYSYLETTNTLFQNTKLVKKLLLELDEMAQDEQIKLAKTLLFSIFHGSNKAIQQEITSFIENLIGKIKPSENLDDYSFILMAYAGKHIKNFPSDFIKLFSEYIAKFKDGSSFNSGFYELISLIKFLKEHRDSSDFDEQYKTLVELAEKFKNRSSQSLF